MQKPARPSGRNQGTGGPNAVLNELRRRFAAFRKANRRGSRIPPALRRAVVEAAEQGVPMKSLWLACGVTKAQIQEWGFTEPSDKAGERVWNDSEVEEARCFSVVDTGNAADSCASSTSAPKILELRIGEWAISIRPLTQTQSIG